MQVERSYPGKTLSLKLKIFQIQQMGLNNFVSTSFKYPLCKKYIALNTCFYSLSFNFVPDNNSYVYTANGSLVLKTDSIATSWTSWDWNKFKMEKYSRPYQSGMISTWNKFCFTGGVLEVSVQLPGKADSGGLWPAVWLLGNLARAPGNADGLWPWSYNHCKVEPGANVTDDGKLLTER